MKTILLSLLLASQISFAQEKNSNVSNDFGTYDNEGTVIPRDKLRYQFEIRGTILVFDKTGQRLQFKGNEERTWRFSDNEPITSTWSFKQKGLPDVALSHVWQMTPDGVLTVKIKAYDKIDKAPGSSPKFGKVLKEKDIIVENFDPVTWVIGEDNNHRVVAKFDINLWKKLEPKDIGRLPIVSPRLTVYDNKGNLWITGLDTLNEESIFASISTHRGTIHFSYLPFEGAKMIGNAEKDRIKIDNGDIKITLESSDNFLPRGMNAKVYAIVDLRKKTEGRNRVKTSGASSEKDFLKAMKEI